MQGLTPTVPAITAEHHVRAVPERRRAHRSRRAAFGHSVAETVRELPGLAPTVRPTWTHRSATERAR
jgi:hypothetical protein